jgi:hypothetical protein
MPIVLVHGMATRDTAPGYARSWQAIQAFLRRYVAPVISDEPEAVAIEPAYWGGVGATFSHGGLARPRSPLLGLCAERYAGPEDALAGMGAGSWRSGWMTRLAESADRAAHAPGFVLSGALAEVGGSVNDVVTLFVGDVFTYLTWRGEPGRPGPIPAAVLAAMRRAAGARRSPDEPMVLVTHSMGGQIAFDLVTAFLPQEPDADHLRVDFWCAQVGLFQELGLFLRDTDAGAPRSLGEPAPPPDGRYLGHWWNVWDYNDFISYSAAGIVAGVDDEAYSSGMSVLTAHSGYLQRPSFYRRLAAKVESARQAGYARP